MARETPGEAGPAEDTGFPKVRTSLMFQGSGETGEAGTRRGGGRAGGDPECSGAVGARLGAGSTGGRGGSTSRPELLKVALAAL